MNTLDIFTSTGAVALDLDPVEVAKLDPNDMEALQNCLFACRAAEDAEEKIGELRKSTQVKTVSHDARLAEDAAANPKQTHQEALLAVIHANDKTQPAPKARKPNVKTRAALTQAIYELAEVRDALTRAMATSRVLNKGRSDAIMAWSATQKKITFEDIHRDMVARSNADRQARVDAGLPADAAKIEPVRKWPIEQAMAAKGDARRKTPRYLGPRNRI
jgi:hypothetical protein